MIPSLYPFFRTGFHWIVEDFRGQGCRAITPESGSPMPSSGESHKWSRTRVLRAALFSRFLDINLCLMAVFLKEMEQI